MRSISASISAISRDLCASKFFQLFALGRFVGIEGLLALGCVLQHVVNRGPGHIERHQNRGALDVGGELADSLAVEHLDDFMDAVSRAWAHDSGRMVDVVVGEQVAAGTADHFCVWCPWM